MLSAESHASRSGPIFWLEGNQADAITRRISGLRLLGLTAIDWSVLAIGLTLAAALLLSV